MSVDRALNTSVLFITLDSCRFDTFEREAVPALRAVGPLHRAIAPSHFTFGSHAAMFMGFTPGATLEPVPLLNPKFAKLFKLIGPAFGGHGGEGYVLSGANIIDGFGNAGFATYGTGAVRWFDPAIASSHLLTSNFGEFLYAGDYWSSKRQVAWMMERVRRHADEPVFAFLNVGETHTPYWHEGAAWSRDDNPCLPFQQVDRSQDCADRQASCLAYLDDVLAPLLRMFAGSTILVCGDHGDCWGEDGVWEHGIPHPAALTVPMLMRIRGQAVGVGGVLE